MNQQHLQGVRQLDCAGTPRHSACGFAYLDVRSLDYPIGYSEAQHSSSQLASAFATVALFGMIQGAIGGYGLMRMFRPHDYRAGSGLRAATILPVLGFVAVILATGHTVHYVTGRTGYAAGFPEIRKMLSTAPATDRSSGQPILSFSRKITVRFTEIKDFWAAEQECAFSSQMTFSHDSQGLWILCARSRVNPQDLLAVKLSIPDLGVIERHPQPVEGGPRDSASMGEIIETPNGVFAAGYG